MRRAQVLKDGSFVRTAQNNKLGYLVMSDIRSGIVWFESAQALARAVTIAIRYSCIRRQSELQPELVRVDIINWNNRGDRRLLKSHVDWVQPNSRHLKCVIRKS